MEYFRDEHTARYRLELAFVERVDLADTFADDARDAKEGHHLQNGTGEPELAPRRGM